MATYFDQTLAQLKHFEGSIPYLYRDSRGFATIGVGLMLPDAASACALPFSAGASLATKAQIEAEFARVSGMATPHDATFYRFAESLVLDQATIDAKLLAVILAFEEQVRARLSGYDAMPDPAKMALLDMVYNLGQAKLFMDYPHFIQFVKARDWTSAAAGCHRRGPNQERNDWTRNQFLAAAAQAHAAKAGTGGQAPH